MYAGSVKIHGQDALAISRDVWCEVQQLSNWYKVLGLWRGSGGAKRKVDLRARVQGHAKTGMFPFHAGSAWQNEYCSVVWSCCEGWGCNDCWKGPSHKIVPRRFASWSVWPSLMTLYMYMYNTK